MKRNVVQIDREKCNGCGLCVNACHEGAIQMVDGKAELVSDQYCDGLGDCLPACPVDAIRIVEREADDYSQEAVDQRLKELGRAPHPSSVQSPHGHGGGCPGTMAKKMDRIVLTPPVLDRNTATAVGDQPSELSQWPVQLMLVNPGADYLKGADLLIAADCTAFAYGAFHRDFIKGRITLIGCPKLDDNNYYAQKLTEIIRISQPKSITVVRMEVPCCGGIVASVRQAMLDAQTIVPYKEVTVGIDGSLK